MISKTCKINQKMGHSIESAFILLLIMDLTYHEHQVISRGVLYENAISTLAYLGLTMVLQRH